MELCQLERETECSIRHFARSISLTSVLQIQGELDSDGTLVFEVWLEIALLFNYKIGPFLCNLFTLDDNPCTFDIHLKVLDGQGGLYPEPDADPTLVDLCFKVDANLKLPYRRAKHIYFDKCFWKFKKPETIANAASTSLKTFPSAKVIAQT